MMICCCFTRGVSDQGSRTPWCSNKTETAYRADGEDADVALVLAPLRARGGSGRSDKGAGSGDDAEELHFGG